MKLIKKILLFLVGIIFLLLVILGILTLAINVYMINYSKEYIVTEEQLEEKTFDCIVVLGASVKSNGTPSSMLEDRLNEAIVLYNMGVSSRLLMSGDHTTDDYDEVNTMKNYAISKNIPSENIYLDHSGYNTYDSMYRLKNTFEINKTVVVTQDYHLYRAIYLAREMGIEAYGVASNPREYQDQFKRDIREILARVKDFFKVKFYPEATVSGDEVSVFRSGNETNEK